MPTTEARVATIRRWTGISALGLVSLGFLALIIALLPPVQRWFVVSLLDSPDITRLGFERVRLRPGSFVMEGMVVEKEGMRVEAGRVEGRGPIWKALFGSSVRLEEYEVENWGLQLDLQRTGGDVPGESGWILAPLAIEVGRVRLAGQVEVIVNPGRILTLEFVAEGGGFGRGSTGILELEGVVLGLGSGDLSLPVELKSELVRPPDDGWLEAGLNGGLGDDLSPFFFTLAARREGGMMTLEGAAELDLPAVESAIRPDERPLFASGRAEMTFKSISNAIGETVIEGDVLATGLVGADSGYRIDRVSSPWRVVVDSGTSVMLRAPVEIERPEFVSDLLIAVTAVSDQPLWRFEGGLSGDNIVFDDLALLGLFFRMPSSMEEVDTLPAWRDLRGRLDLEFGRVRVGPELTAERMRGVVMLEDEVMQIRDLEAGLAGGDLSGGFSLRFDPSSAEPHTLEADWTANGVEIGRVLAAAGGRPLIDGPFGAELTIRAVSPNMTVIKDRLTGKLEVIGGPGVFMGLAEQAQKASSIAGLLGTFLQSERLTAVADLSEQLQAFDYDQFRLSLSRSSGGGLEVGRIQLQGAGIKLAGEGWIGEEGTVDFAAAPMRFEFRLGAKGALADSLEKLGLTSIGRIDAEGYRLMLEPFSIRGTPARPDASELWSIVRKAAMGSLLGEGG